VLIDDDAPQETLALGREELQRLLLANPNRAAEPESPALTATKTPAPLAIPHHADAILDDALSEFDVATEVVALPESPPRLLTAAPPMTAPPTTPAPASSVFMRRGDIPRLAVNADNAQARASTDGGLKKGEVGELLRAISPFLWGLDDAARYMDVRAALGDVGAQGHQRTLKLLGTLLRQLQQRIDDSGL
jgi:hypothetical protein